MTDLPRITIIMPSYNQATYLEEAICSVLDQNYPNLEFMILDGGSTDGSAAIIERYANRLTYWYSRPDKGQTDALIHGFARATGDLMGWVNSDDVLLPGCLDKIAQLYKAHPTAGLFGGNYILIDSRGKIIRCRRHPDNPEWFARLGLFFVNQPGSFFKRDDYEAVGGLHKDLNYFMDNDLYVRMMINCTKFAYINAYLSGFRIHSDAKTVSQIQQAHDEGKRARKLYWPRRISRLRTVGKVIYFSFQTLNGNFIRVIFDTIQARDHYWSEWVGTIAKK